MATEELPLGGSTATCRRSRGRASKHDRSEDVPVGWRFCEESVETVGQSLLCLVLFHTAALRCGEGMVRLERRLAGEAIWLAETSNGCRMQTYRPASVVH